MARNLFGGTASDVAEDLSGARVPSVSGTVWDGPSGTQVTDLLDSIGAPITTVTADVNGMLPEFQGPDNGAERLWLDFGAGARVAIVSANLGDRFGAHLSTSDPHGSLAGALGELEAQKGSANGLATLDALGLVPAAQIPAIAQAPQMVDWINVKAPAYGALGNGTTDDTVAIRAAISAAGIGGTVYFPKGVYRISGTLDLPRGVTLMGSHSNLMVGPGMADEDFPCYIQAAPSFTTGAMIQIIGDNDGTHPAINGEQRIFNLMLDGSKVTTGSLDGIYAKGNVQNVVLRDVCVRKVPNNGIITGSNAGGEWPYSWRLHSVMVDNCKANGIFFERQTDLSLIDCQVIGAGATGFKLVNCANTLLIGCRAEWTGTYGFHLTGDWGNWPGSGAATMSACSTDRCGWDGVRVDATGNGPFLINSLMTRRDGRNGGPGGGGYSGLALRNQAPVIASGVTCYVGTDDAGTANTSPQYGVRISGARDVQIDNAYLHGLTEGLYDDGTNQRVTLGSITSVTGNNFSENRVAIGLGWVNVKGHGAKGDGFTDDTAALQAAVNAAAAAKTTVYLPTGTYLVSAPVTLPAGQGYALVGSGWGASVKLKGGSNCYIFKMTAADTRIIMRDLTIDGNCLEQGTAGSSGGVDASGAVACRFDNVHFIACRDDAIYLGGMAGGAYGHNNRVIGCLFDESMTSLGPGRGIHMNSSDENQIIGCDFEFLGGSAGATFETAVCILDRAGTQFIDSCNFVGGATNNTKGVRIQDASSTKVIGCNFDGTAGDSVFIAGTGNSVTGCTIFSPGEVGSLTGQVAGIHLEFGTKNNLISGNSLASSPTNGKTRSLIREEAMGDAGPNLITGNVFITKGTLTVAPSEIAGAGTIFTNNLGA
ncbi:glycosyl hydrolase family 28-related protein [Streptomyces prunicolor]|uniref:glycosyl hydrolase family 28-related protein n=1 Tax=Streptomyces prunicolor TaxID=67348 RepID=UPI003405CC0D